MGGPTPIRHVQCPNPNKVSKLVSPSVAILAELVINLELKFLGLKKIFRYTFMTLLKLFYFTNFSLCQFKKWSTGKLRLS